MSKSNHKQTPGSSSHLGADEDFPSNTLEHPEHHPTLSFTPTQFATNLFLVRFHGIKLYKYRIRLQNQHKKDQSRIHQPVKASDSFRISQYLSSQLEHPFIIQQDYLYSTDLLDNGTRFHIHIREKADIIELQFESRISLQNESHLLHAIFSQTLRNIGLQSLGNQYCFDFSHDLDSRQFPTLIDHYHEYKKDHLKIIPGITFAFQQATINEENPAIFLEMDMVAKIMRTSTVWDDLHRSSGALQSKRGKKQSNPGLSRSQQSKIEAKFTDQLVETQYNGKIYRISGIAWDKSPRSLLDPDNSASGISQMTFLGYYQQNYGIDIHKTEQPLLMAEVRRYSKKLDRYQTEPIYLIPELCRFVGSQASSIFNPQLCFSLTKKCQFSPKARSRMMLELIQSPQLQTQLKFWGIAINPQFLTQSGGIFSPITLQDQLQPIPQQHRTHSWQKYASNLHMIECPEISRWMIVYERASVSPSMVQQFGKEFQMQARLKGWDILRPKILQVRNLASFMRSFDGTQHQRTDSGSTQKLPVDFVLTITPGSRKSLYRTIKQSLHQRLGIPSQNILAKNVRKKSRWRFLISNLLHQIICKIPDATTQFGGYPWAFATEPGKQTLIPDHTLLVGLDVWHGSRSHQNSVAAVVCSFDGGHHFHTTILHQKRSYQEFLPTLGSILKKQILEHLRQEEWVPQRILIYRDGVGHSQISHILAMERTSILRALAEIEPYRSELPSLALILVNKRIHRKMFAPSSSQSHTFENPLPGSWVQDPQTFTAYPNRYLISYSARIGTVRPCHYTVISNSTALSIDELIHIGYGLSHLYYNYPGPIKLPNPVQYAHLAADHVAECRIKTIHPKLSKTLYYI